MHLNRNILAGIGIVSISGVGIALISQYLFDMPPCAWCVFQRLIYLVIALVCFAGSIGQPGRLRLSTGTSLVLALSLGGITAAWYQANVAANSFSCSQTLADQLMTQSGLESTLPALFGIYASCMDAKVSVLGIEYAYWSMALFSLLGLAAAINLLSLTKRKS